MTVKQMLDMIWEDQQVKVCFRDGIQGRASDLAAALNDGALSKDVEWIDVYDNVINIYLK